MPHVTMAKMTEAMDEGTIVRWLKNEGDPVEEEEPIAEVETDKATVELSSTEAGILTRILAPAGATVPVGQPIALIGEEVPATAPAEPAPAPSPAAHSEQAEAARPAAAPSPAAAAPSPAAAASRVKASPLARKVASEHEVDLQQIAGSGPGGRIVEADVTEALQRQVPAAPLPVPPAPATVPRRPAAPGSRPLSTMRKVIARRLAHSKQTLPHFYATIDVDMRAAMALRKQFNSAAAADATAAGGDAEARKLSVNDLVARAVVLALTRHPLLNSRLDTENEQVVTPDAVHLGIAVALEDGLIVPVIRDAQAKGVTALSAETRALAARARAGSLKPEEYSGGTFTITNLGMYDIVHFQAIINAPEAAILAVGAVRATPIVENDAVVPGQQMYLTLSADHRLVDGHVGALFLQEVRRLLETPLLLLG